MSSPGESQSVSPRAGEPETPERITRTVVLPSPQTSQESPFNLPELPPQTLSAPEWVNDDEAVVFFLQVWNVLRVIMNKYCSMLKEAMGVFEKHNATHYKNYANLECKLNEYWAKWKEFSQQRNITADFLLESAIYLNFDGNLRIFFYTKKCLATIKRSHAESL
jgi:hypothetical protein